MPSLLTSRLLLLTLGLLHARLAVSQLCYYPDGKTVSRDVACNTTASDSACCSPDSFCLGNGLCFGNGIVSRGSCTDRTWGSAVCAGYCKTESPSDGIAITPCTNSSDSPTFACGLNNDRCQNDGGSFQVAGSTSLVLRASQIAALLGTAVEAPTDPSSTNTSCPAAGSNSTATYTAGDMAGLGCGLGLPLFFALCAALFALRREKQKYAPPKLMYQLPDNCQAEVRWDPPRSLGATHAASTAASSPTIIGSSRNSYGSAQAGSFIDRYDSMRKVSSLMQTQTQPRPQTQRHELESLPATVFRHELGDGRR